MPASPPSVAFGGRPVKSVGCAVAIVILLGATGCNSIRQKVSRRCENCSSLCKQACEVKDEGYPDQADLLLNEALRQRPTDLETRRQLAESLWVCGRQGDSVAEYKRLAQIHPNDIRLQQRLAVMSWTLNRHDEAAGFAEASLRISPNCGEALLVKARTQAAKKDFDAAAATYIRLTTIDPNLVDAKLELAEVHIQRGHACQACTLLRDVMEGSTLSSEQLSETEWRLGLAYAAASRWAESAEHLSHAVGQRETSAADWQFVIYARSMAGQETMGLNSSAILVSGKEPTKAESSPWNALRDQLLQVGRVTDVAGKDDIIRADFRRTAQAETGSTQ